MSKELIRKANLGRNLSLDTKQKISINSANSKPVIATNNETEEVVEFSSISSFAKFINVDESYVRRCINNNKPCKNYTVVKK